VKYTDAAIEASVELRRAHQRLHLPDKAIDVIDEAGARVRLMPEDQRPDQIPPAQIEEIVAKMARSRPDQCRARTSRSSPTSRIELNRMIFGQTRRSSSSRR